MTRTRLLAGGLVLVAAVGVVLAVTNPFHSSTPPASAGNGVATSTTTVQRRDLSAQTQQSATLGYASPTTISIPPGTAPTAVQQAQAQSETAAQSAQAAQATLADDQLALSQARAVWSAGKRKLAADCNGDSAAGQTTTPCAADMQAGATQQQAVEAALAKVQADRRALAAAQTAAGSAGQSLASAQSSASAYGQTSVYTMLPAVGRIVRRGEPLYAIDGAPTLLLYGTTAASRPFQAGMSPGPDVSELNANLAALGYGSLAGDTFTSATQSAIEALQAKHGLPVTGRLLLGSVVFQPSVVRVTSVTPSPGGPVQAGPVLTVTSTKRIVAIQLDAASQTSVRVGDRVVITLPDNSTTPGHVSFVGTVATTPSSSDNGNGSSSPTIEVDVTPDRPAATGRLDQAPVDVSITTDTVHGVLSVPVQALLALAGGGYALEVVGPGGVHSLEAVQLGLFDDAEGLVEVSGPAVRAGQRVVVPSTP
jgi:putative peptidoglycan binding protein